jgi:sugar (pentulose or hexulose) kinase
MSAVIGLDIGTTKIGAAAIAPSGELLASVARPNDGAVSTERPGQCEQDPLHIRQRVVETLRELTARVPEIAGIGLTGQMHGMLCVDADNRPLGNLITWQDQRCLEPATPDGKTWLDLVRERVPAVAWESCGCQPASGHLGCTLFWAQRAGKLPQATARVCFIHDWVAGVLAGQLPFADPSDAASAGIFDLKRLGWHGDIIAALEIPANLLPPVRESGAVIGALTPALAQETGLRAGTPVCNAIGDNQASVLGSVADPEHSVLVNLGTGGQISWAIPHFERVAGMETRYLPADQRDGYMLVGTSLCGGRAYAWLADVVRDWLRQFGPAPDRDQAYARLNELAASAPSGGAGLRVTTTLAGTRADPAQRGSIHGISLDNFALGNLARAVLEGAVDELAAFHDRAPDHHKRQHQSVVASGNAVRKNPLLRQIIADRFGRPVLIPRHCEEAAYGAALLAGVSVGVWPSLPAAGRCIAYLK